MSLLDIHLCFVELVPVLVIMPGENLVAYIQRLYSQVIINPAYIVLCHLPDIICSVQHPTAETLLQHQKHRKQLGKGYHVTHPPPQMV